MVESVYDKAVQLLGEDVSTAGLQYQNQLCRIVSARAAEEKSVASVLRYTDPATDLMTLSMYSGSGAVSTIVSINDFVAQSGVAAGSSAYIKDISAAALMEANWDLPCAV